MKALKFLLARWFGEPYSRVVSVRGNVETTITGYLWRGTFYASGVKHKKVEEKLIVPNNRQSRRIIQSISRHKQ